MKHSSNVTEEILQGKILEALNSNAGKKTTDIYHAFMESEGLHGRLDEDTKISIPAPSANDLSRTIEPEVGLIITIYANGVNTNYLFAKVKKEDPWKSYGNKEAKKEPNDGYE